MLLAFILSLLFVQCLTKSNTPKPDYTFNKSYIDKLKASANTGYIELNEEHIQRFSSISHSNRDFHLFVFFTSLDPSIGCAACPQATQMYRHLINIYERKAKKGPLPAYFAFIEFKNNMKAFQLAGVDKIPTFVHFGPKSFAPTFMSSGAVTDIVKFIEFIIKQSESNLDLEEAFKPESNYNGLIAIFTGVAILAGLIVTKTVSIQSVYQSVYLWGTIVLSFITLMLSGLMWVRIRKPPFVGSTNGHDTLYVANALASQLGIECRIVAGLVAASSLILTVCPYLISRVESNNRLQVFALLAAVAYLAAHAGLLKVFSMKAPGYPISHIF